MDGWGSAWTPSALAGGAVKPQVVPSLAASRNRSGLSRHFHRRGFCSWKGLARLPGDPGHANTPTWWGRDGGPAPPRRHPGRPGPGLTCLAPWGQPWWWRKTHGRAQLERQRRPCGGVHRGPGGRGGSGAAPPLASPWPRRRTARRAMKNSCTRRPEGPGDLLGHHHRRPA
jgi:hypothetical protein